MDARPFASANIADRLATIAATRPDQIAIAAPRHSRPRGRAAYDVVTFQQLEEDSTRLAAGLQAMGIRPGHRIVLLVRPGIDFIALTYALFKTAAVVVLIDPGMGRKHLLQCLEEIRPNGFVAIPIAQWARCLHRKRFPHADLNVTVGRGGPWMRSGTTLDRLRRRLHSAYKAPAVRSADAAAIIFTTGSTGPPKGVQYEHGNFATQVDQLQEFYQIRAGETDLPGFPLFALFNSAMGVTTVIPDMDPRRPAQVDPLRLVTAMNDWQVTQAFGSPAIWNVVGQYCDHQQIVIPTLRRVLSAGAPVPPHVLARMKRAMPADGDVHTPYGATESLPVASIAASEVLASTASRSAQGAGTCVGRRFSAIRWRVIRISDEPIGRFQDATVLAPGQIGELIVQGPAVTRSYVTRTESNVLSKILDDDGFWHRMGDVGYLDDEDRFWFCGRKAHRVETIDGTMFTVPCEAIYNQHPAIYRSALVGIGQPGRQDPVMICEPWPGAFPSTHDARTRLLDTLYELGQANSLTQRINRSHLLLHRSLPVDIRHNAKIFREELGPWAAKQLRARAKPAGRNSEPA